MSRFQGDYIIELREPPSLEESQRKRYSGVTIVATLITVEDGEIDFSGDSPILYEKSGKIIEVEVGNIVQISHGVKEILWPKETEE